MSGEASEVPWLMTFILWVGVFSAVTWGMMVLFRGTQGPRYPDPASSPEPRTEEPSEE